MKMKVTGFKHSKGDFNGTPYNKLTLYTLARLEQKETQRGSAGIDMPCDLSLLEKLNKIDFDSEVICDVEIETRATGKGQFAEIVVSVVPVVSSVASMGSKS